MAFWYDFYKLWQGEEVNKPKAARNRTLETLDMLKKERAIIESTRRAKFKAPQRRPIPVFQPLASMVDLNNAVIGKTEAEAEKALGALGYLMRVMLRNGESCTGTMEIRNNRANVEVLNGTVTRVIHVG